MCLFFPEDGRFLTYSDLFIMNTTNPMGRFIWIRECSTPWHALRMIRNGGRLISFKLARGYGPKAAGMLSILASFSALLLVDLLTSGKCLSDREW